MEKITIAVGSTRRPKLNAVIEALQSFASLLVTSEGDVDFEVVGVEVESGVGHTPSSRGELMRGARQRAEALAAVARETAEPWRYFIGLEGGIDVVHEYFSIQEVAEHNIASFGARRVFLESWAYVSDGARGYFGRSGGVELPEALAYEVLEKEIELSEAIDRFAMQQNPDRFANASGIRNAQGAWGVLSGDLISRQEAFRVAVLAAFAPFYNAKMYEAVQRSGINERATGLSQGVATNTGVN